MAAPGMAAGDPADAEPDATGRAVSFDRLRRVGRTGRPVPAVGRATGSGRLIPADGQKEDALGQLHDRRPPATVLTPSDTIVLNSPYDSPAAAGAAAMR